MTKKWISTNKTGVRYYSHPSRKTSHGQHDRNFIIRYKRDGKTKSEVVGWSTDGMNASKAAALRAELVSNIS